MIIFRSNNIYLFLNKEEKETVTKAVHDAELTTSGEIRVHLKNKLGEDPIEHGKQIFEQIGMTATKDRNGVLILLGVKSHQIAILGDTGINDVVPQDFWQEIINEMLTFFKKDEFGEGLAIGISRVGKVLQEHFPYSANDTNELSNAISYSTD